MFRFLLVNIYKISKRVNEVHLSTFKGGENNHFLCVLTPLGPGGFKSRIVSSVSPACRKRRLNGVVSQNNHIKRVATLVGA